MSFPKIGQRRTFQLGVDHVSKVDPKIRQLIKTHGMIEFEAGGDSFESLVEAIISQQLNGRAAKVIFRKLKASVKSEIIDAQALHKFLRSELKKGGVSPQKIRYLKDLSSHVVKGRLNLEELESRPDDEVIRILDAVKG